MANDRPAEREETSGFAFDHGEGPRFHWAVERYGKIVLGRIVPVRREHGADEDMSPKMCVATAAAGRQRN